MKERNRQKGDLGERAARKFLKDKKYIIIEKNYKTPLGEIDIIAMDKGVLVFVEVKAKDGKLFGSPAMAVTKQKQRTISQVAATYIKRFQKQGLACRFDVIEVYLDTGKIEHIENAFDSYLSF